MPQRKKQLYVYSAATFDDQPVVLLADDALGVLVVRRNAPPTSSVLYLPIRGSVSPRRCAATGSPQSDRRPPSAAASAVCGLPLLLRWTSSLVPYPEELESTLCVT